MSVDSRPLRSWAIIVCSVLAAACLVTSLILRNALALRLIVVTLGLALAGAAMRPKAPAVEGALFTGSADLLGARSSLPGQLSVTPQGLTWVPSPHLRARGVDPWSATRSDGLKVTLQRGPALLDLILTAEAGPNDQRRFLTHGGRRLKRAIGVLNGRT